MNRVQIIQGHVLEVLQGLAEESVQCCVTSPPYWGLRDYGIEGQVWGGEEGCGHEWSFAGKLGTRNRNNSKDFDRPCREETGMLNPGAGNFCRRCGAWKGSYGLEPTPELYIQHTLEIFREVRRMLRKDGTLWLNLGDTYAAARSYQVVDNKYKDVGNKIGHTIPPGLKPKDLCGIPWRLALALQADGWWLRSDIIWAKPNPMPESCTDRPTKAHEYIFLFAKGQWKSRIIKFSDLPSERFHFGQNIILNGQSTSLPTRFAVNIATSIFNFTQSQKGFGLPPFYSEEWKQKPNGIDSDFVGGLPEIHRTAALCARFLVADCTTKEFFEQMDSCGITLPYRDNLLIGGAALPQYPLPPGIFSDGKGTITIHDSGQICKVDFLHKTIILQHPVKCQYYYDQDAVRENNQSERDRGRPNGAYTFEKFGVNSSCGTNSNGRNLRTVWDIATAPFPEAHFATFPPAIPERCIKAGSKEGDIILDPFSGAATTLMVAAKLGRDAIGIELNPEYVAMSVKRLKKELGLWCEIIVK